MKFAVVRLRGKVGVKKDIEMTLNGLKLKSKLNCVLIDDTPSLRGAIKKLNYFVTWGEVSDETMKLLEKRRKNSFYALMPPRGGFERKGTKAPYRLGGALGYRGEKINDLLRRMV